MLLLDPPGGQVLRTLSDGHLGDHYEGLRIRYGRHVPMPSFRTEKGFLIEEFIYGKHLLEIPESAQIEAVGELIDRYGDLVTQEAELDSESLVCRSTAYLRAGQAVLPEIHASLGGVDLISAARSWPLVPSATDPSAKNILIVGDHTPVPIDLLNLRLDPFFSFPVGVVAAAGGVVLRHYLEGGYDIRFTRLFDRAGSAYESSATQRHRLIALRLSFTASRRSPGSSAVARAAQARLVNERWLTIHRRGRQEWR